jgi:hypothetical protein
MKLLLYCVIGFFEIFCPVHANMQFDAEMGVRRAGEQVLRQVSSYTAIQDCWRLE